MNQAEIRRRQAQTIANIFALITLAVIARLAGYNGVTYVAVALEVFAFFHTIVSGGVSDALGRLLKIKKSKGQFKNADRMRRNVMLFQLGLGLAGTALVMAGSGELAVKLFGVQYSAFILVIIAPSVFLRAVSETLVGYCRGEGAELPAAAAGIVRQILILLFSLLFCRMLGDYGERVSRLLVQENFSSMYGGVGVALAVTLTEILVVLFLFLIYKAGRRAGGRGLQEGMRATASFADSVRALWSGRGAHAGIWLLGMLFLPIGLIFFVRAGGDASEYGVWLAGYGVVCGVCVMLVLFLVIPVYGRAVQLLRKEEQRFARTVFQSGVHVAAVHSAFLAAFFAVMAKQAAVVFCAGQEELAAKLFRGGSAMILLAALTCYFGRMLILTGKKYLVLGAVALADVVFLLSVAILLKTGKVGILSLIYAGIMGGGVLCVVLGMFAYRQLRLRADLLQILVVPVAVACVTGFAGMMLGGVFTPHLGEPVSLAVCFVIMAALYWTCLLLLRNFREQELEAIPGGGIINAVGQLLRVF